MTKERIAELRRLLKPLPEGMLIQLNGIDYDHWVEYGLRAKAAALPEALDEIERLQNAEQAGFNKAIDQVMSILRDVGDLGDGDYIWDTVSNLRGKK